MTRFKKYMALVAFALLSPAVSAQQADTGAASLPDVNVAQVEEAKIDTCSFAALRAGGAKPARLSLYELPYSLTTSQPDWKRLWINAGIFTGAYVGTLVVLECLPEGATNWNRAAIENTTWYKRWWQNVVEKGPEWDGDDFIFNYVLHPYAGAVYFMAARSCGFNFYQSLLFSACVSTIGWEFGIEGTMERPSIQDIFITPVVGSALGELFYKAKRYLAANDYRLLGSRFLGGFVAFIIDPVNEVVGLFAGNPARKVHMQKRGVTSSLTPSVGRGSFALTLTCTF